MDATMTPKRRAGEIIDGEWRVMTESKDNGKGEFVHHCGQVVRMAKVSDTPKDRPFPVLGNQATSKTVVFYCPQCEEEPTLKEYLLPPSKK